MCSERNDDDDASQRGDRRIVYDGAIIRVVVDRVRMPDGTHKDREVVEHADTAAVVALDDQGRVLLIEQHRHPVDATLVELPAGLQDDDDADLLVTAKRELREEVGLTAQEWTPLLRLHTSPGILTESAQIFLARDLAQEDRDPDPSSEETEIVTRWVPLAQAVADVRDGKITDVMAVAGLLALQTPGH